MGTPQDKAPRPTAPERTLSGGRVAAFSAFLFLDFVLVLVMLATDKNLQTDFGSVSPYYLHWYGLLAEGVIDLLVAVVLVVSVVRPAMRDTPLQSRRGIVVGAVVWTALAIIANVAIVATYSQVGFKTESKFEMYLFGTTAYPGALSYIPWLYDLLLAVYVVTLAVGIVASLRVRAKPAAVPPPSSTAPSNS
jgi:hypothetical protein